MDFKKLIAYKKSFDLGMAIYNSLKSFPKEETYALTDQIRRSSRSILPIVQSPIEREDTPGILLAN